MTANIYNIYSLILTLSSNPITYDTPKVEEWLLFTFSEKMRFVNCL